MFDIFAMLLSSIATFLFPVFASYKALNTADPALLKPWLMYWVVLACALLVESWFGWLLFWIPFYGWLRALFLLWLIAPQTQGARLLYETHLHPFLRENEFAIDDFISSAHGRLKVAGLTYLRQLIDLAKEHILGIQPRTQQAQGAAAPQTGLSYAQTLLNRFNLPSSKPVFAAASSSTTDVFSLLANAVQAYAAGSPTTTRPKMVPDNIRGQERASFIQQQKERLTFLLSALDREATQTATPPEVSASGAVPQRAMFYDGQTMSHDEAPSTEDVVRDLSTTSDMAGLTKSMSVGDFEKIDETDEGIIKAGQEGEKLQRPKNESGSSGTGSGWMPWAWGSRAQSMAEGKRGAGEEPQIKDDGKDDNGKSSAIDVLL